MGTDKTRGRQDRSLSAADLINIRQLWITAEPESTRYKGSARCELEYYVKASISNSLFDIDVLKRKGHELGAAETLQYLERIEKRLAVSREAGRVLLSLQSQE